MKTRRETRVRGSYSSENVNTSGMPLGDRFQLFTWGSEHVIMLLGGLVLMVSLRVMVRGMVVVVLGLWVGLL